MLPRVIGHRGAKGVAPENTAASIRAASDIGCSWVEVDVMLTSDKVRLHLTKSSSAFAALARDEEHARVRCA